MQGIILAGGKGSRLYPMTTVISKQLLPVYDKPMIYYPISTLMLAGIRDICIISDPLNLPSYRELLGDGSQWGIIFRYVEQKTPDGLPQAFTLCENLITDSSVALILGDNIFHGAGLGSSLSSMRDIDGGLIFGYAVEDPSPYGVVTIENGMVIKLEEKPRNSPSNLAIPGLYFFDRTVFEISRSLRRSSRGEYEIIDVLKAYLDFDRLTVSVLPRGTVWLDSGTPDSLEDASSYVRVLENRQGLKICCPEEVAYRQGYITKEKFAENLSKMPSSAYKSYLGSLALQ